MASKGYGGSRRSNAPSGNKSVKEIALEELEDYYSAKGYWEEMQGDFKHMDVLMTPAKSQIELFRGTDTLEVEEILKEYGLSLDDEEIFDKVYEIANNEYRPIKAKNFKSATTSEVYARDYMGDYYDRYEERLEAGDKSVPEQALLRITVSKGAPIIRRRDYNQKRDRGAEGEHTLGRKGAEYALAGIDYYYNRLGDRYWVVDLEYNKKGIK